MHALILSLLFLAAEPQTLEGRVVSVSDGDTITILSAGTQVKIRLAGIDAPEKRQPWGSRSRERLGALVHGQDVTIATMGQDRYGRTLGTVFVHGVDVNHAMISEGLAWHYVQFSKDKRLMIAEHDAREFRHGLWSDTNPIPPWLWRKQKKLIR